MTRDQQRRLHARPSKCFFVTRAATSRDHAVAAQSEFSLHLTSREAYVSRQAMLSTPGIVTIQQNTKIIGGAMHPSVVGPDLASVPCFALLENGSEFGVPPLGGIESPRPPEGGTPNTAALLSGQGQNEVLR